MKKWVVIWLMCMLSSLLVAEPYFLLDSEMEWNEILVPVADGPYIRAADPAEWADYMAQREMYLLDGDLPEPSVFLPPDLYVFPGDPADPNVPDEAGLVMAWGDQSLPEDNYTSGFIYQYGVDPDLRNCTLQLTVHPPTAIVMVSFGLTDIFGSQCSWTWNNPANIPTAPPSTTIIINTNNVPALGVNSSTPAAGAFSCNPAFDMSKVATIFINETFHNSPGVFPPPTPGGGSLKFYWNAWDNMQVVPNNGGGSGGVIANTKSFIKYSQPPVTLEEDPGMIIGWDELSVYDPGQVIMADDWECKDERPITDIHWWGSFIGWTQPTIPSSLLPKAFHIGIWTDVPKGADEMFPDFSHPGVLIWENYCDSYAWNFAGYDLDPRGQTENEACFQFNQLLSQDEWFRQPPLEDPNTPNIYWLSIAAVYEDGDVPQYPWGWKTREHFFMDDAVRIDQVNNSDGTIWPPSPLVVNQSLFASGRPVEFPEQVTWDLAFELTTNEQEPCHGIQSDLNHDCKVDLPDLAIFASEWLMTE